MRSRMPGVVLAGLLGSASFAAPAAAQECIPSTGILDTFPASGSSGLPLNTILRVRYTDASARNLRPEERVQVFDGWTLVPGAIAYDEEVNEATFFPADPLRPDAAYDVVAVEPLGTEFMFRFRTGTELDDAPPDFAGLRTLDARRHPSGSLAPAGRCQTPREDGFILTASFPAATDAVGPANIEYVLYQTRGFAGETPIEQTRIRGFVGALQLSFYLPLTESEEIVCVNVQAVDLFGRMDGNVAQKCIRPLVAAHFRGLCATGATPGWGDLGVVGLLAIVLAASRRRARPHP